MNYAVTNFMRRVKTYKYLAKLQLSDQPLCFIFQSQLQATVETTMNNYGLLMNKPINKILPTCAFNACLLLLTCKNGHLFPFCSFVECRYAKWH